MSSEVKQTQQHILRAMSLNYKDGTVFDCLDLEVLAAAADEIAALEAECERLRGLFEESEQHLHHWQRQAAANGRSTKAMEQERDALAAELAAIRAAGREQVEVVGYGFQHVDKGWLFSSKSYHEVNPCLEGFSLMTVAQHQRIVAAMAAELHAHQSALIAEQEHVEQLEAELEAARKQKKGGDEDAHY